MATLYNTEVKKGQTVNGVTLLSASNDSARILFNTVSPLLTAATITAAYVNTAGTTLSSGTGTIEFNPAYNNTIAYIILQDRTSFRINLSTGVRTLTANGNGAWGPTERRLRHLEII